MAVVKPLEPVRRSIRPNSGDSLEAIASRVLPTLPTAEAVAKLQEWNPHLLRRQSAYVLVSDIVFIEAPKQHTSQGGWA
jgi:hypothetical protein